MSKDDLYELFGAPPSPEQTTPESSPVPEQVRIIGSTAAALYDLDFSAEETEIIAHKEKATAEMQSELAAVAVAEVVELKQPDQEEALVFSDDIIARFDEVLSLVTNQSDRIRFSLHDMERLTQHLGPLSHKDRWYFRQYCKQHPAFDYFGNDMFGVAERITPETYWPGIVESDTQVDITTLAASTFGIMSHTHVFRQEFQVKHILGIVKSQGIELYTDELDAFLATLTVYPGVIARENGSLHVDYVPDEPDDAEVTQKQVELKRPVYEVRNFSDVKRAINDINSTDEMKRVKDLAKNYADVRRLHKTHSKKRSGKRSQGRLHGKKQVFTQLLQQSIANAPKETSPQEIIVDGSAES